MISHHNEIVSRNWTAGLICSILTVLLLKPPWFLWLLMKYLCRIVFSQTNVREFLSIDLLLVEHLDRVFEISTLTQILRYCAFSKRGLHLLWIGIYIITIVLKFNLIWIYCLQVTHKWSHINAFVHKCAQTLYIFRMRRPILYFQNLIWLDIRFWYPGGLLQNLLVDYVLNWSTGR